MTGRCDLPGGARTESRRFTLGCERSARWTRGRGAAGTDGTKTGGASTSRWREAAGAGADRSGAVTAALATASPQLPGRLDRATTVAVGPDCSALATPVSPRHD